MSHGEEGQAKDDSCTVAQGLVGTGYCTVTENSGLCDTELAKTIFVFTNNITQLWFDKSIECKSNLLPP